jgi:hypothetical protein
LKRRNEGGERKLGTLCDKIKIKIGQNMILPPFTNK